MQLGMEGYVLNQVKLCQTYLAHILCRCGVPKLREHCTCPRTLNALGKITDAPTEF